MNTIKIRRPLNINLYKSTDQLGDRAAVLKNQNTSRPADFIPFKSEKQVGVIEAKLEEEGVGTSIVIARKERPKQCHTIKFKWRRLLHFRIIKLPNWLIIIWGCQQLKNYQMQFGLFAATLAQKPTQKASAGIRFYPAASEL